MNLMISYFFVLFYIVHSLYIPCKFEGRSCDIQHPCCKDLICYEETACISNTTKLLIK